MISMNRRRIRGIGFKTLASLSRYGEALGPAANGFSFEWSAGAFDRGELHGEVTHGGAFDVAGFDRHTGVAGGKLGEKLILAPAAEDMDAPDGAAQHLLQTMENG